MRRMLRHPHGRGMITTTVFVISTFIGVVVAVTSHWILGATAWLALFGFFFLEALVRVTAYPPHRALLQVFGERIRKKWDGWDGIIDEGLRLLPFRGMLYDAISINVTKRNLDFPAQRVRTPDQAEITVPLSITYTPTDLYAYIDSGGDDLVPSILSDMAEEALREWAISPAEGPANWEQALQAQAEALPLLINALIDADDRDVLTDHEINRTRRGNGRLINEALGITINRVNIGEMRPTGKLLEAAELAAAERRERDAEIVELEHIMERMAELQENQGLSPQEALQVVQTERGKVSKHVQEIILNVGSDAKDAIKLIGDEVARVFSNRSRNSEGN